MKFLKLFFLLFFIGSFSLSGQSFFGKDESDKEHGGIGLEFNRPNFGKYSGADKTWMGINIVSDMFEGRLLLGKIGLNPSEPAGFSSTKLPVPDTYGYSHNGANLSVGINAPISSLGIGVENSSLATFRLHPTLGGSFGLYSFWPNNNTVGKDWFAYIGLKPGYRARLPFVTVDLALNIELGLYSGDLNKPVRPIAISPSLIFRLNSQKSGFNMRIKKVDAASVSTRETSRRTDTRTRYEGSGRSRVRIREKVTTSTYDVKVKKGSMSVQDIGTFLAGGPVFAFSNPRRHNFQPASFLYGGNVTFKQSVVYTGINVLVGKTGHGSTMDEPLTKNRSLDRKDTFGRGTYNSFNAFLDIGMDLSPLALAVMGIARGDIGNATPYFSLMGGFTLGVSRMGNQQFVNSQAETEYDLILAQEEEAKDYRVDPRKGGFGKMGGWWLGVDVGVVSFKMRSLTHKKSPFANNRFFELAYKIPLAGR